MNKFLRQVEFRGFLRHATDVESHQNWFTCFEPHKNFLTGLWAYCRYALPIRCDGVAKINLYGCQNEITRCSDAVLGIGSLWVQLPKILPVSIDVCSGQQKFMVELAHRGLEHASNDYKFDFAPFEKAKLEAKANEYRFEYQIGKAKTSPNRLLTAFVWCFYDRGFKTDIFFRTRDGATVQRKTFAVTNEQTIANLRWLDNERVHISSNGFNDSYWICDIHGKSEFVFGLAKSDAPHHLYMHAIVLIDGQNVLIEREKGRELLKKAASMGFKHAIRRLASM